MKKSLKKICCVSLVVLVIVAVVAVLYWKNILIYKHNSSLITQKQLEHQQTLNTQTILKKIKESKTEKNLEKKTAIIVEPRKCEALPYVLSNFFENLDETWSFIIYCGNLNKDFVEEFLNKSKGNRRVNVINLNVNNLPIDKYNDLFLSQFFYDNIKTEIFLVFQTDTLILKKTNYFINYFYKFDYCGAPWSKKTVEDWKNFSPITELNYSCVGNGGLSLRKKSKMLEILKDYNENIFLEKNEDVIFSGLLTNKVKIKKPSDIEAMFFSVEAVFSPYSFGIHKLWEYLDENKYNHIIQYHPDVKTIENLYKKINKK